LHIFVFILIKSHAQQKFQVFRNKALRPSNTRLAGEKHANRCAIACFFSLAAWVLLASAAANVAEKLETFPFCKALL
jgi:hypothetical protein